jgi:hypothetical protein
MSFYNAMIEEFGQEITDRVTELHNAYGLVTVTQENLMWLQRSATASRDLLFACEVAWCEIWEGRICTLRREAETAEHAIRLAGEKSSASDFWRRRRSEAKDEIAVLENVREEMDKMVLDRMTRT